MLKDSIQKEAIDRFGSAFFYEHGRAGCCMNENPDGTKCEHFHLHCLPKNLDITKSLNNHFHLIEMSHYSQIRELFLRYGNYLYVENNGKMHFYPVEAEFVEPHYLRTLVCEALQVKERSNWEDYEDHHLFVQSVELIGKFKFYKQKCPL